MQFLTIITLSIGLAMDAFAVSIVSGTTYRNLKLSAAMKIAFFFGAFQAIMPIIGAVAGLGLRRYIEAYDHWVAFVLLFLVGGKMLWESFKIKEQVRKNPADTSILFILAVATSIDAMAVGFSLPFMELPIFISALIIGIITFAMSLAGVYIGKRFGHFFENSIEAIGGVILILIGFFILIRNL